MLDALDRRLLDALQADPRASYRALARHAGTTTPTAIARIRRMTDLGAIQGFRVMVAPWAEAPVALPSIPMATASALPLCHQCHGALPPVPVEHRIAGRHHLFCCTTCRDRMVERSRVHQA